MLNVRPLRESDERSFLMAIDSFKRSNPDLIFAFDFDRTKPFANYIAKLNNWQQGRELPRDFVPNSFLIAEINNQIVGRVSIRHTLNDFLQQFGGHIGYAVIAECRRMGYASELLRASLAMARGLGLTRILITCDDNNEPSIRVIEKNRGRLENSVMDPTTKVLKRRYWMDVSS